MQVLLTVAALALAAQQPPAQSVAPRAAPTDYQAQAKAGSITIAADFTGHAVPVDPGPLNTEDYVVVEVGLYGPAEEKLKITASDFSLAINSKKNIVTAQPFGMIFSSLKDPSWEPPEGSSQKGSKTKIGGSGGNAGDPPPTPPKMPIELVRAMQQRVQKSALPEGDRVLPQAGLLFFQHRGKTDKIKSLELVYSGPAGTATLTLQP